MSKTNFTNPNIREAAVWKLMIKFKPEHAKKYPKNPFYYYGYNKKKNKGLDKLMNLAQEKENEADLMILYRHQEFFRYIYKYKPKKNNVSSNNQPQSPKLEKPRSRIRSKNRNAKRYAR